MARRGTWNDDAYSKQARREGYVARSAYKLLEIQEKFRVIRRNQRVLDLGCAPGAWLQVASPIVGEEGVVVGIDLQRTQVAGGPNCTALVGDIYETDAETLLKPLGEDGGRYGLILSDMAPSTGGGAGGSGDHFLSIRLCERVLDMTPDLLKPSGKVVMKVFEGEALPDLRTRAQGMFKGVKSFKPRASRSASREIFLVCGGFKPVRADFEEIST
ncbi:MAG: SAM-dependent methyltransferase [Planctomycetota bacterium]|jgi:23S rRNA (uridine2552-2'-O)-methyltransferase